MSKRARLVFLFTALLMSATSVSAMPFFFSTGNPDGLIATASRPSGTSLIGIESADDFALSQNTSISSATFTGLLTGGASPADIASVGVEIYRVFPQDSDLSRTSGAPVFGTTQVPTRVNSPSDTSFALRDSIAGTLSFSVTLLTSSFTVNKSVKDGGINPTPNQTTGGDGSVTGDEVQFDISFTTPIDLAADHYFFVPQVALTVGDFLWLSAPKPIVPPGTPFAPDLQSWIRDDNLSPDWLRIGTDIVGGAPAPTFNAAFSLTGDTGSIPEPDSLALFTLGVFGLRMTRCRGLAA